MKLDRELKEAMDVARNSPWFSVWRSYSYAARISAINSARSTAMSAARNLVMYSRLTSYQKLDIIREVLSEAR